MKYTPLMFGEGSGSVGGIVFSRNTYGDYIRKRITPVNPNSAKQQVVRNIFAALAVLWHSTLTQVQRDAWNLYGKEVVMPGTFGSIHLTGFNHYLRSNVPILQVGGSRVDDGPVIFTLPEADPTFSVTCSEAAQMLQVTFDNGLPWADENGAFMPVTMSMPRPASREFIGGPYRMSGFAAGVNGAPPASPIAVTPDFAVAETQKVECFGRILRADGRVSMPFRDTFSVAA